jgi:hypothetical protein
MISYCSPNNLIQGLCVFISSVYSTLVYIHGASTEPHHFPDVFESKNLCTLCNMPLTASNFALTEYAKEAYTLNVMMSKSNVLPPPVKRQSGLRWISAHHAGQKRSYGVVVRNHTVLPLCTGISATKSSHFSIIFRVLVSPG